MCCLHPWFHQWCHQAASAAGSPGDWKAWSQCPLTGALRGDEERSHINCIRALLPPCDQMYQIQQPCRKPEVSDEEKLFMFPITGPPGPEYQSPTPAHSDTHVTQWLERHKLEFASLFFFPETSISYHRYVASTTLCCRTTQSYLHVMFVVSGQQD